MQNYAYHSSNVYRIVKISAIFVPMFQLDNTIVSEDLLEKEFVCNLSACKGACCVQGEAGAPLEKAETKKLEAIYQDIKPLLRKQGIEAIEQQGAWITSDFGELETPLVNDQECAYVIFDENGVTKCGIEEAYNRGFTDFRKPISCHLYPVRVKSYTSFAAVNYHKWDICDDACQLGKTLQVPVYQFVKEALTRKFGKQWYQNLENAAKDYQKKN